MKRVYLCYILTPIILLLLFLINFFFIDINVFSLDIDRQFAKKYEYLDEKEINISPTLIGFLVKDNSGIHYAKTAISGKEKNIIVVKQQNKYIVILPTEYGSKTKYELLNKLKNYTIKTKKENTITIEKVRSYTKVDPLNVFPYKDENGLFRLKAPNLIYNTIDTPNIIFFEQYPTNNGYDAEIYYDSKNTYYIITPYNKEALLFLTNGFVDIPEELFGARLKTVDEETQNAEIKEETIKK